MSVPLPIVDASTPPTGVTVCVSDLVGAIFSRHVASHVAGNATLAHVNFGFQGCNWPIIEHLRRGDGAQGARFVTNSIKVRVPHGLELVV